MNPWWLVVGVCTAHMLHTPDTSVVAPVITPGSVPGSGWFEQYNDFIGQSEFSAAANPVLLNSKVTSYRYHNSGDLRAWTKYLVESHKAQAAAAKPSVAEFDIDAFIDYLVHQKHFREKDLQFLRRPGLDYGHDQIERELTKIKQKQEEEESKTINIGGETIEGSALCVGYSYYAVVGFVVFLML